MEARLALQFLVIAMYLLLFDVVFTFLPLYTRYRWHLYLVSVMYVVNNSLNPFIYLTTRDQFGGPRPLPSNGGSWQDECPAASFNLSNNIAQLAAK